MWKKMVILSIVGICLFFEEVKTESHPVISVRNIGHDGELFVVRMNKLLSIVKQQYGIPVRGDSTIGEEYHTINGLFYVGKQAQKNSDSETLYYILWMLDHPEGVFRHSLRFEEATSQEWEKVKNIKGDERTRVIYEEKDFEIREKKIRKFSKDKLSKLRGDKTEASSCDKEGIEIEEEEEEEEYEELQDTTNFYKDGGISVM